MQTGYKHRIHKQWLGFKQYGTISWLSYSKKLQIEAMVNNGTSVQVPQPENVSSHSSDNCEISDMTGTDNNL